MPKIDITTTESVSVSSASATSTVVLLPIFLKHDQEMSESRYYGKNYATDFDGDWSTKVIRHTQSQKTDPSYTLAKLLINAGLNILVKPVHYGTISSEGTWPDISGVSDYETFKNYLASDINQKIKDDGLYEDFKSVGSFNISYVTSGAHYNCDIAVIEPNDESSGDPEPVIQASGCYEALGGIATSRGDCVALIELAKEEHSPADLIKTYTIGGKERSKLDFIPNNQNCAIFYPWCNFGEETFPAGVAYLKAFANSLQTNPDWMAAAGVSRGLIPDCTGAIYDVTESLAEKFQGQLMSGSCVNPIMNINNYGLRVWGNRTGKYDTASFLTYLNVKVLLNLLRKQIYAAASAVTFEPNDDITWVNFKSLVNTLLDKMVSGRGIRSYSWVRNANAAKATIDASLIITPIEAVENFVININLRESSETGTTTVDII